MIKIDRLSLRLPQGFESRANAIAHRIATGLERHQPGASADIDRLETPPVSVFPHEGDEAVAQKAVAAILNGIEGRLN